MDFKDMSKWGKTLYVIAWIYIVEAFAMILLASLSIDNSVSFSSLTSSMVSNLGPNIGLTSEQIIKYTAIASIISAIVILVIAILAIRASRDNSKVTPPLVIYGLNSILVVVSLIISLINKQALSGLLSYILPILAFVCCLMIKLKKN